MTTSIVLGWERARAPSRRMGFLWPDGQGGGRGAGPPPRLKAGPFRDGEDGHVLVVAPTGKGKSRCLAIPQLLSDWPASAVVLDIKGELAATTADYRARRLGHRIVRLDPWRLTTDRPDRLNPLDALRRPGGNLADLAYRYAEMLAPAGFMGRDPFWSERAQTAAAGMMADFASLGGGDCNLGKVYDLLHGDDPIYAMAAALDARGDSMAPFAAGVFKTLLKLPDITRGGVLCTAESLLRAFAGPEVQEAVSTTDFDIGLLARGGPVTIYLVIPPDKLETHVSLVRLWLSTLLGIILERKQRPRLSTLLLLDEVAQLGAMPQIRTLLTLARGYGARAMLFVQSLAMLRKAYPDADTLIENVATIVTFGHNNSVMSADMSALFGDILAEALYALAADELAVKQAGRETRILRRCDYVNDVVFRGRASPNGMFRKSA